MKARCGCVVEPCPSSGVLRSVTKCAAHRRAYRDPATLDERYYRDLGVFGETAHLAELLEALGPFPAASGDRQALEIGCGCSPYAGAIKAAGWRYVGIDASPWAAEWTRDRWGVSTLAEPLESFDFLQPCGLILAAHVLEHLDDAPGEVRKLARALAPGGELWVIVPDDSDLCNPDHLWFFTEATLRATVEAAGLSVVGLSVFRRVRHERFIYCRAVRPA